MNKYTESISPDVLNPGRRNWDAIANRSLSISTTFWFILAVTGQWLFAYYILAFYGSSGISGNFEKWDDQLEHAFISGDFIGNLMIFLHVALAFSITFGGPLQLIPRLRKRFIKFHRWNGRVYVLTAFLISFAGLYIVLIRGVVGSIYTGMGNTINAALIMLSAFLTWRFAVRRKMEKHRRWAIRLFLVVSGVWFFRLAFALWILIHQGAPGHNENFNGPFDIALAFGHTLIPLFIYEIYLSVQDYAGAKGKLSMAGSLFLLSLVMGAGIVAATMMFWLPNL